MKVSEERGLGNCEIAPRRMIALMTVTRARLSVRLHLGELDSLVINSGLRCLSRFLSTLSPRGTRSPSAFVPPPCDFFPFSFCLFNLLGATSWGGSSFVAATKGPGSGSALQRSRTLFSRSRTWRRGRWRRLRCVEREGRGTLIYREEIRHCRRRGNSPSFGSRAGRTKFLVLMAAPRY